MRKVFIVGDSLFAEAVTQLLSQSSEISVAGAAARVTDALTQLPLCQPDIVIVLGSDMAGADAVAAHSARADAIRPYDVCPLLEAYPDLPILRADLQAEDLRLIRSQRVGARSADLLAAIHDLPSAR